MRAGATLNQAYGASQRSNARDTVSLTKHDYGDTVTRDLLQARESIEGAGSGIKNKAIQYYSTVIPTVLGAYAGSFVGAPVQGASIGATIGNRIGSAITSQPKHKAYTREGMDAYFKMKEGHEDALNAQALNVGSIVSKAGSLATNYASSNVYDHYDSQGWNDEDFTFEDWMGEDYNMFEMNQELENKGYNDWDRMNIMFNPGYMPSGGG